MALVKSLFDQSTVEGYVPKNLAAYEGQTPVLSKDLVGIEVEVENVRTSGNDLNRIWTTKQDGSLRNNGFEFVTAPIEAHYAPAALQHLMNAYLSKDCCFSPRTSVHVHLNMQDMDAEQVIDFLVIYSVFEKLLYRFAGRGRIKNIYCVPVTECNLLRYFVSTGVRGVRDRWSKYTGLNLIPLSEFGTVEFRHMHGTFDVEKLSTWINLITSIKDYIRKTPTKDVRSMLFQMNDGFDFEGLMKQVFGEYSRHLKYKSVDDVRLGYRVTKMACLKNTSWTKILNSLSGESPFFKGFK